MFLGIKKHLRHVSHKLGSAFNLQLLERALVYNSILLNAKHESHFYKRKVRHPEKAPANNKCTLI